jgi:chemotaxis regulatin CheY-phosphate phosphatase CheZ
VTRKIGLSEDLLDDSEATLRLVDSLLDDLREGGDIVKLEGERMAGVVAEVTDAPSVLSQLPNVLLRAYSEINVALESLRQSRGVLERATLERVQRTQENLRAVSSATEKAATDMLDGLDRALLLIDRLDSSADPELAAGTCEDAGAIRGELRDELFHLIGNLQFQDITSQQLRYASGVLEEIEERLVAIADLFHVGLAQLDGSGDTPADQSAAARKDPEESLRDNDTFDPAATMLDADKRQAVADEIFTVPKAGEL